MQNRVFDTQSTYWHFCRHNEIRDSFLNAQRNVNESFLLSCCVHKSCIFENAVRSHEVKFGTCAIRNQAATSKKAAIQTSFHLQTKSKSSSPLSRLVTNILIGLCLAHQDGSRWDGKVNIVAQ